MAELSPGFQGQASVGYGYEHVYAAKMRA